LKDNGYRTGAAVSHSLCSSKWNFDQGFEEFDESNIKGHFDVTSAGVTNRGINFIDRHINDPFFLWLHYFDPHFAYIDHSRYPFKNGESYRGRVTPGMRFSTLKKISADLTQRDLREILRLYDSEIASTDHQIGRLLDHLRSTGAFDDSLIIFTADHGEEFMDHDRLGHTKTLHSEVVSVPLLIKLPHGDSGAIRSPVALVDIFPTILHYLGLSVSHDIAGSSLFEGSSGKTKQHRARFSETSRVVELRAVVAGDLSRFPWKNEKWRNLPVCKDKSPKRRWRATPCRKIPRAKRM